MLKSQLGVVAACIMAMADLWCDLSVAAALYLANQTALLAVHLLITFAAAFLRATQSSADSPILFLATSLRLNYPVDAFNALFRPSYASLHPAFASPHGVLSEAALKSIPHILMHSYISLSSIASPHAYFSVVMSLVSISWALATYEVQDFKHRLLLQVVPWASWEFLQLVIIRFVELAARLSSVALYLYVHPAPQHLLAIVAWGVLMYFILVQRVFVSMHPRSPQRQSPAKHDDSHSGSWFEAVVFMFVFWDRRRAYGRQSVIPSRPFLILRCLEALVLLFLSATKLTAMPYLLSFNWVYLVSVSLFLYALLIPHMVERWSGHRRLQAILSTPDKRECISAAPSVAPASVLWAQNTTPVQRVVFQELAASPKLHARRAVTSPKPLFNSTTLDATILSRTVVGLDATSPLAPPSSIRPATSGRPLNTSLLGSPLSDRPRNVPATVASVPSQAVSRNTTPSIRSKLLFSQ